MAKTKATPHRLSPEAITSMVLDHLQRQEPFCLLRWGDGEYIAAELSLTRSMPTHPYNKPWQKHAGFTPDLTLKREWLAVTRDAFATSDVVGIHTANPKLQYCGPSGQYMLNLLKTAGSRAALCDANIHFHLMPDGYRQWFESGCRVFLATGHNLEEPLRRHYPGLDVRTIPLPLQPAFFPGHEGKHFPALWRKNCIDFARRKDVAGALVLMGGGLIGKAYGPAFRQAGAIFVDTGSVFDRWAGYRTRGAGKGPGVRDMRFKL